MRTKKDALSRKVIVCVLCDIMHAQLDQRRATCHVDVQSSTAGIWKMFQCYVNGAVPLRAAHTISVRMCIGATEPPDYPATQWRRGLHTAILNHSLGSPNIFHNTVAPPVAQSKLRCPAKKPNLNLQVDTYTIAGCRGHCQCDPGARSQYKKFLPLAAWKGGSARAAGMLSSELCELADLPVLVAAPHQESALMQLHPFFGRNCRLSFQSPSTSSQLCYAQQPSSLCPTTCQDRCESDAKAQVSQEQQQ